MKDFEDDDSFEKIYRKKAKIGTKVKHKQIQERIDANSEQGLNIQEGLVISVDRGQFSVRCNDQILSGTVPNTLFQLLKDNRNFVAVGDIVRGEVAQQQFRLVKILPRKNELTRQPHTMLKPWQHVLASNIDLALVTFSLVEPAVKWGFIDRLLFEVEMSHISPILLLNKCDLLSETADLTTVNDYQKLGYTFIFLSNVDKRGYSDLFSLLNQKKCLFLGQSGVGKSTIINNLIPNLHIKTGEISDYNQKGTHTTTKTELHTIQNLSNSYLIDSPGLKVFNIKANFENVLAFYHEFTPYLALCQWKGCNHINQQGCAVEKAVNEGIINRHRYQNYINLITEVQEKTL